MRFILPLLIGLFCGHAGHACEVLLGGVLTAEQLRPHMIVEVQQPAPTLERDEIADTLSPGFGSHPDFGLDTYLESMNVRGTLVVSRVNFSANNTVEVDVLRIEDFSADPHGGYSLKTGAEPIRLSWGHLLTSVHRGSAMFRWIGFTQGDGNGLDRMTFTTRPTDLP